MNRLRRWKRNCCLLLLAGILLLILLCVALFILIYQAQAQGTGMLPLDVLLLIDHSNSMWDKGGVGSDPDLLRVQAANLFIAYLGVDTARSGSRLGVIHFGGSSELVVPPTPLDSAEGRQAIRDTITNPQRMDWTDPLEALQLAYETLFPRGQRDPVRQPVVILLTDGKPEVLPKPSPKEQAAYVADLRALVDRFHEQECPIFTIALSNEATDADPEMQTVYRNLWQEIAARTPPAEYHEARTADDLPRVYHAVVAGLSGAEADVPVIETTVDGRAMETIAMESGLAQVRLVVLRSDPALEMRLLRPGGAPARLDDPDVRHTGEPGITHEEVWAITNPRSGRWTLELQGHGAVVVWQDSIRQADSRPPAYGIEMAPLPVYIPAGQPVDIVGISVREASTGELVAEPGLQVVIELRCAGFVEAAFLARDDGKGCDSEAGNGRYCAVLSDSPPGVCILHLRAMLDGEEVARREVVFEAVMLPELEVTLATPISPPKNLISGAYPEQNGGPSGPGWILPLAGLVALGGVWGLLLRRCRAGVTLDGSLRVLAAPPEGSNGVVFDLPAMPSVVLGGMDKRALPLPGEPSRVTLRAGRTPEGETETWVAPLAGEGVGRGATHLKCAWHLLLNDRPLKTARRLCDGDVLTLGGYRLRYESLRQAGARRARHRPRRRKGWMSQT